MPNFLSACEAADLIQSGELRSVDLTQSCLNQIERLEDQVHAWVHLSSEAALEQAALIDAGVQKGKKMGALSGVPVGIKDIFNTLDMPTQMGSPLWKNFTPGNDARVVHYLRMADAIFPGKTVTAEFAVHAPGPTSNPHRFGFSPGTSSSGSAAAVASYMVPLALGTQTAGSTIRPASYCGVYGFKPSFGLIPRTGMLKTTDSLDTVGFFARTVEDLSLLFEVIRVHGLDYPMSHELLNAPTRKNKGSGAWRVALIKGPKWDDAEADAQRSILKFAETLSGLDGITVEEVLPSEDLKHAHDIHSLIYDKTLAYYFAEEFKNKDLVSAVMYEIIDRGQKVTLDEYKSALQRQRVLAMDMDSFFEGGWDIVLNLSTGGEALEGLDSVDRPDNCLIWTLCGLPAMNLPVFVGPLGLPFGAQIVARRYSDYKLLSFARWLRERRVIPNATFPEPILKVHSDHPSTAPEKVFSENSATGPSKEATRY
jgi:Asp-tRNA(Asn)/Glu-tRNA(Gln) amidotransferase A subunit family amidase